MMRICSLAVALALATPVGCASVLGDDFEQVDCAAGPPTGACDEDPAPGACDRCRDCGFACACEAIFAPCLTEGSSCDRLFDCYDLCEQGARTVCDDTCDECKNQCDAEEPAGLDTVLEVAACLDAECPTACASE